MKRFEKAYEEEKPLIQSFLGKHVKVKVDTRFVLEGQLIYCQSENKVRHFPSLLILKDDSGRLLILRGNWLSISGGENGRR
jgi:hypothetical protein